LSVAEPELSPQAQRRRPGAERKRPALALLLSLLVHALLLSLTLGGQGGALPGLVFPWQERRAEAPELRVLLVPPRAAALQPAPQAPIDPPVADAPALLPFASPVLAAPAAVTATPVAPAPSTLLPVATAAPSTVPSRNEAPAEAAPAPAPEPAAVAVTRSEDARWAVPPAPAVPTPAIAAASSASSPPTEKPPLQEASDAARARIEQEARERAAEQAELARARREAQRQAQQQAQQQAEKQEAARQDEARTEAARLEAERQAAVRQAAARQEAARQEAARQEAARAEAGRQEAARQEAARQEGARQEAARQEAARQDALRREAARVEAARLEAAQAVEAREARLRAIGRQLDEEAARRDAATAAASRQSPTVSSARRGRLFGRSDANAELVQYAETWSRKIQLNMTFDMVREAVRQPHTDPVVTVAVRSDGSVESVSFVRSSGVPAIDEGIRRIVNSQANYPPFQPALAREYDVVEIRRTWHFDMAIRLY